jgi:hypothetical protein
MLVDQIVALLADGQPVIGIIESGLNPARPVMDLGRHVFLADLAEKVVADPGFT